MDQLLVYLFGLISTALIGIVKKYTTIADTAWFNFIKPFQPIAAAAITYGLPLLWNALHLATPIPDSVIFTNAPVATIVAVVCAEIYAKINPPQPAALKG